MKIVRITVQEDVPGLGWCFQEEVIDQKLLNLQRAPGMILEQAYLRARRKLDNAVNAVREAGPAGKLP